MTHPAITVPGSTPFARPAPPTVPLRQLAPFLILGSLLLMMVVYFVGVEQGATSLTGGHWVHEFVHDGRHMLGLPCH